jgi:hypothetical protein
VSKWDSWPPAALPEKQKPFPILHNSGSPSDRYFNHLARGSFGITRASNRVEVTRGTMKTVLAELKELAGSFWQNKRARSRAGWGLGIFLVLQLYFVRELIAAELLFGLLFALMLSLAGLFYAVGTIGVNGLDWAEAGVRVVANSARRTVRTFEEISKKPFRHPHSESAQ